MPCMLLRSYVPKCELSLDEAIDGYAAMRLLAGLSTRERRRERETERMDLSCFSEMGHCYLRCFASRVPTETGLAARIGAPGGL